MTAKIDINSENGCGMEEKSLEIVGQRNGT